MRGSRRLGVVAWWLVATAWSAVGWAAEPSVSWSKLSYRITKLMITVRVDVEAGIGPLPPPLDGWIESPEGTAVRPLGREMLAVRLDTRGAGRSSILDLWADPTDWAALQRSSVERGRKVKDYRYRGYRFLDRSVFSVSRYPASGQVPLPASEWSERKEEILRLPVEEDSRFVDAATLFWIVSMLNPTDPEAGTELDVWLRRGLFRLQVAARELTQIKVDFVTSSPNGEARSRGDIPVRRFTVTSRPLYADSGVRNFRFAGLSGDIEVFVDVRNRVPVQISGDLRPLGRGHLKLKEVQLDGR